MAANMGLENAVADFRGRLQLNGDDPKLAATAMFDAVTTLMLAAVEELSTIRKLLEEQAAEDA